MIKMDKNLDTPGKRIKWALDKRDMSAAELGRRIGITRSAVSQWWGEKNPTSPLDKIEEVAEVLKLYVNWLLTGEGEALLEHQRFGRQGGSRAELVDISAAAVVGIVEGEVWREGAMNKQHVLRQAEAAHSGPYVPSVPRPDISGLKQFAFEIRGTVCNQIAQHGQYAICCDYDAMRPGGFVDGDLVVVEKRRDDREYKLLVARLHFRTGWELHYESNDPRWQKEKPIRLTKDMKRDAGDHTEITVLGYMLGIFHSNLRPQSERSPSAFFSRAREFMQDVLVPSTRWRWGLVGGIACLAAEASAIRGYRA